MDKMAQKELFRAPKCLSQNELKKKNLGGSPAIINFLNGFSKFHHIADLNSKTETRKSLEELSLIFLIIRINKE